jgi:predicted MFS family arabinose efflux permease
VREIAEGFRYVASEPWLWMSILIASFVLMIAMAPYQSLLPALVDEEFGRGVGAYGAMFTFQSAGMVVGSLVFARLNPRRNRMAHMCVPLAVNDVCVVVMVLLGSYELALGLVALRGACIGYGMGVWPTLMMELVPESKLARAFAVDFFGSLGLTPVGYALAAVLTNVFAPAAILVAGFSLAAVLWVAPLSWRRYREAA